MLNMEINKNTVEIELGKLYAIWLREFKVFLREKSRLVASTFTPLLWLFVIGAGFGSTVGNPSSTSPNGNAAIGGLVSGIDYQKFIFPGIICMSVIFTSVFFGSYIIWDRKFDFLKSVMVAPSSRTTVFVGKTLGGMTTSLFQVGIILIIGMVLGINYDAISLLQIISIVLILSFGLTSLGLTFGSYIESLEGFQLIVSFVVFPLFFLSGALFPIDNLPPWLKFITLVDPATYSVDALRNSILHLGTYSFDLDIELLLLFTLIITLIGIFSFKRMKAV